MPSLNLNRRFLLLGGLTIAHGINDFYGLVIPFFLPVFITEFSLSYTQAGLLALFSTILSGVLQPAIGYLADQFGLTKPVMVFGFTAFAIGLFLIGATTSFLMLLFFAFIYGLGEGTFHAQSTKLITQKFAEAKGRAMGIHGIGGSIGNFLAPIAVSGLIIHWGWRTSARMLMIPAIIAIILLWIILPRGTKSKREPVNIPNLRQLLLIGFNFALILMIFKGFLNFLPTYIVSNNSTLAEAGYLTSVMLIVGVLAQPLGGQLFDRLGGRFVFMSCALLIGIALVAFTFSSGIWQYLWVILIGASATATFPVALAFASEISSKNNTSISVGIVFGISSTLSALTPTLTGIIADNVGLLQSFRLLAMMSIFAVILAFSLPDKQD